MRVIRTASKGASSVVGRLREFYRPRDDAAVLEPVNLAEAVSDAVSLDREGFALVQQISAVRDFYNEDQVKRVYYPEAERLIKAHRQAGPFRLWLRTLAMMTVARQRRRGPDADRGFQSWDARHRCDQRDRHVRRPLRCPYHRSTMDRASSMRSAGRSKSVLRGG